jgi:flagellar biosynthesis protein FlhA
MHTRGDGTLNVLTLDQSTENLLSGSLQHQKTGLVLAAPPETVEELRGKIKPFVDRALAHGEQPVLLAAPNIRLGLRRLLAPYLPQLAVLSINELMSELEVFALHQIGVTIAD